MASLPLVATGSLAQQVQAFEDRLHDQLASLVDTDDVYRVCNLLVTGAFATGDLPWHWQGELGTLNAGAAPRRARVVRQLDNSWGTTKVFVGDGWVGVFRQRTTGEMSASISARDSALAATVADELRAKAVKPKPQRGTVELTFVHDGRNGTTRTPRQLPALKWPTLRRNYAPSAHETLDGLMTLTPDTFPLGHLILVHGPTGTGKSTLIQSLAAAWSGWCSTEVVLDPDRFLSQTAYFNDVTTSGPAGNDDRWRLLVLEDCDEYLRSSAKTNNGQTFARLLNITDGLVSHGAKLLVCMTTAEPLGPLHPAVLRPGRRMADIQLPLLSKHEAATWLAGRESPKTDNPDGDLSLAELYASLARPPLVRLDEPYMNGIYL